MSKIAPFLHDFHQSRSEGRVRRIHQGMLRRGLAAAVASATVNGTSSTFLKAGRRVVFGRREKGPLLVAPSRGLSTGCPSQQRTASRNERPTFVVVGAGSAGSVVANRCAITLPLHHNHSFRHSVSHHEVPCTPMRVPCADQGRLSGRVDPKQTVCMRSSDTTHTLFDEPPLSLEPTSMAQGSATSASCATIDVLVQCTSAHVPPHCARARTHTHTHTHTPHIHIHTEHCMFTCARRLSADPNNKVLLLEAGGKDNYIWM
jgi:hypothetical protein